MSHVMAVFNRLGYRIVHQRYKPEEWDVMWSHGYPFGTLKSVLQNIKPHQKVCTAYGTSIKHTVEPAIVDT